MARLLLPPSLGSEFPALPGELVVDALSLYALVRAVDGQAPGFATFCETRAALAVDGVLASDWAQGLSEQSEVLVVPRIAGG